MQNFNEWVENLTEEIKIRWMLRADVEEVINIAYRTGLAIDEDELVVNLKKKYAQGLVVEGLATKKLYGWFAYHKLDYHSGEHQFSSVNVNVDFTKILYIKWLCALNEEAAMKMLNHVKNVKITFASADIGNINNIKYFKSFGLEYLTSFNDQAWFVKPKTKDSLQILNSYFKYIQQNNERDAASQARQQQRSQPQPQGGEEQEFQPPSSGFTPYKPWQPGQEDDEEDAV